MDTIIQKLQDVGWWFDDISRDCVVIDAAPPHRFAHHWLHSGRHPIDFLADTADVSIEPRHRYIDIAITKQSDEAVRSLNLPLSFVVVAAGPCYTGGNWPPTEREKVVDLLHQRNVQCVSIGGSDSVALRGTIDLCNKFSANQAVAVIKRASLYIGPDTGTSWLACAARGTPKVCVLDKDRLRDGVVGFQGFLSDRNIRDVIAQDGAHHCFEVACNFLDLMKGDDRQTGQVGATST